MAPKKAQPQRRALYPAPVVIEEGFLAVPLHRREAEGRAAPSSGTTSQVQVEDSTALCQLWYCVSGNPCGVPVVLFHGGPGYYTCTEDAQLWNPALFKIVCFDQRGSGKSTPQAYASPAALYQHITMQDIIADAEDLRRKVLGAKAPWIVCGCSWGSAVAVAYAIRYGPQCVCGMLVQGIYTGHVGEHRGLFTPRPSHEEALGLFQSAITKLLLIRRGRGSSESTASDESAKSCESVAMRGSDDPLALHQAVRDAAVAIGLEDDAVQRALAQWSLYENYFTYPDSRQYFLEKMRLAAAPGPYHASRKDVTGALMQLFLFPHMMQLDSLGPAHQLRGQRVAGALPVVIVQGDADEICDASAAQQLFTELALAPKRQRQSLRYIRCPAAHDVLDGGPMQTAFMQGTATLFDLVMS